MTNTPKKTVTLGSVKNITIFGDNPKFTIKNMELNKAITMMVGPNGSGKTFVHKVVWSLSTYMSHLCMVPSLSVEQKKALDTTMLNLDFILDGTFHDIEEFIELELAIEYENAYIHVIVDKGVAKIKAANVSKCNAPQRVVYMSTNFRLFHAVNQYISVRSLVKDDPKMMDKLLKTYRLYDIMYVEELIMKTRLKGNKFNFDGDLKKMLEGFDPDFDIVSIRLDEDLGFMYSNSKGKERSLSTLGNGHQSLINMILGQLL